MFTTWTLNANPLYRNILFAAIAGIEIAIIDAQTSVRDFQQQLRNNEVYYAFRKGWTIVW